MKAEVEKKSRIQSSEIETSLVLWFKHNHTVRMNEHLNVKTLWIDLQALKVSIHATIVRIFIQREVFIH